MFVLFRGKVSEDSFIATSWRQILLFHLYPSKMVSVI